MTTPMLSRPSLQRKILIPKPSEKKKRPVNEATTTAVVHQEQQPPRVAPASVNWLCRLCSFEAINKNGLRLHYFRSHGHRTPPDDRFSPKSGLNGPTAASKKNTSAKNKTTNNPAVKFSNEDIEAIPSTSLEGSSLPSSQGPNRMKSAQSTSTNRPSPPLPLQESRTFVNRNFSTLPVPPLTAPTPKTTPSTNNPSSTPESNMPDRSNDPLYPYASFNRGTLRYCFPVPHQLKCPMMSCKSTFGTKAWYTTNTSIKKHLNTFHKAPPTTVEFWCFFCKRKISKNPAGHPCLKNKLVLPRTAIIDDDDWICHICKNFSASTTLGKQNHLASHNREIIRNTATPLTIPLSTKQRKRNLKKKIQTLAEGDPGSLPLARPVATASNTSADPQPAVDTEEQDLLDVPEITVLSSFCEPLDALLEVDDLENAFPTFEKLVDDITETIREHFHLSLPNERPPATKQKRKVFDSQNAQEVQKLYKWNRRRCVRNIASPSSTTCSIDKDAVYQHFRKIWGPTELEFPFPPEDHPNRPHIIELLDLDTVRTCLQGAENSAPGQDRITYKQWREVDPRCVVLCKIFNICLKFKNVPGTWKTSNTVLIHKKGDPKKMENWRPIALSNTIYKLFAKCITRKLQDWCSLHDVLSPAQKGFTPYDGVIEHNFLLSQHLELARRNGSDSLLAWLDISNAFGSVPHDIIFKALKNIGADDDFIGLVQNIYEGSCSRIITEDGLTEPISILRGVKQGCPLSGILFNVAINHVLLEVQKEQES
ncbi:retrovirus-related Pol polyprotein from type-2 retrotransposable element R2DM, partial [Nephila pilipes]